jgi:hypothetical protein
MVLWKMENHFGAVTRKYRQRQNSASWWDRVCMEGKEFPKDCYNIQSRTKRSNSIFCGNLWMSRLKSILIFCRCRPSYLTFFRYFCTSPFSSNRNLRLNNQFMKSTFHTIFKISAASCEQRSHTN